ncbi:MAG: CvpA family protein [Candidatus Omnitrophota bacterium]
MEILNRADIVALLIILYFTCFGWVQGIMRFLLGFIAFFLSSQIAIHYFQGTQNILESLKIFLFLSAGISLVAWFGLSFWNKAIVKSRQCTPLSRLLGATVGFCWALSLASALMVFLVLVRIDKSVFKKAKKMCEESYLYTFIEHRFLSHYPLYQALKKLYEQPPGTLQPSSTIISAETMLSAEDLESINQDEKLQAVLADEQIKKMIEEKDFGRLLSNPKIQDLVKYKVFIEKLIKLYGGMAGGQ